MGLLKGESLSVEQTVLPISNEVFINAYIEAYDLDPNPTFGRLKEGASFLRVFLAKLNIEVTEKTVPKLLQSRLKNRYIKLESEIQRKIKSVDRESIGEVSKSNEIVPESTNVIVNTSIPESIPESVHQIGNESMLKSVSDLHVSVSVRQSFSDLEYAPIESNNGSNNDSNDLLPDNLQEKETKIQRQNKTGLPANIFEKIVKISVHDWQKVHLNGEFVRDRDGIDNLCNILRLITESRCIFIKRDQKERKKWINLYFYCKHKLCRSFQLKYDKDQCAVDNTVQLELYRSANDVVHNRPQNRPLIGTKKKAMVLNLRQRKPNAQEMHDAMQMDPKAKKHKDLDSVYTVNVYRNNRKEALALHDYDDDTFEALWKMKQEMDKNDYQKSFVQFLQKEPFELIMFSNEQLDAIIEFANEGHLLHAAADYTQNVTKDEITAAGVVKKVNLLRIATTVPVINQDTAKTLVLLDALTLDQTQYGAKVIATRFKQSLLGRQKQRDLKVKWPLLAFLVVDKDLSLYHGLCEGLNGISFVSYINIMYEIAYENEHNPEETRKILQLYTPILQCFNHFTKTISDHLKNPSKCPNLSESDYIFLFGCFKLFGSSTNYFHICHNIWFNICIILNSSTVSSELQTARNYLQVLINDVRKYSDKHDGHLKYFPTPQLLQGFTKTQTWNLCIKDRQYKQTGFFHDFNKINEIALSMINSKPSSTSQSSSLYFPDFIQYFLKHQSPYICAISPFLRRIRRDPSISHSSNAVVEGSFAQTKNRIREDINLHEKDRADRVFNIENERKYIDGVIKLIQYKDSQSDDNTSCSVTRKNPKFAATEEEEAHLTPVELSLTATKYKKKVRVARTTKHGLSRAVLHKTQPVVLPLLRNGLVADPLFYTNTVHYGQYYVAQHATCFLFIEDFLTLISEKAEIISSVIQFLLEHFISMSIDSNEILFVPFEFSGKIFVDKSPDYTHVNIPSNVKTIIFHHIIELGLGMNHHVLAVADLQKKEFYYCDSLKRTDENRECVLKFRQFKNFIAAKGFDRKKFSCLLMQHLYQTDGYSCGLFVIRHGEAYLKTGKFIHDSSTELENRMALATTVLDASVEMSPSCLVCSSNIKTISHYQCKNCNRFVHSNCIVQGYANEYSSRYSKICPLCTYYMHNFA